MVSRAFSQPRLSSEEIRRRRQLRRLSCALSSVRSACRLTCLVSPAPPLSASISKIVHSTAATFRSRLLEDEFAGRMINEPCQLVHSLPELVPNYFDCSWLTKKTSIRHVVSSGSKLYYFSLFRSAMLFSVMVCLRTPADWLVRWSGRPAGLPCFHYSLARRLSPDKTYQAVSVCKKMRLNYFVIEERLRLRTVFGSCCQEDPAGVRKLGSILMDGGWVGAG